MGKAYANKKKQDDRPKDDTYHTPFSLTWKLNEVETFSHVWEPCNGKGAISKNIKNLEKTSDIATGTDFLKYNENWNGDIVTNFPFYLWDECVQHAKNIISGRLCTIGRINYFGTYQRTEIGIWNNLHKVYIFNRYVDYQTPYREDGKFHVGALCTGWFIWNKNWKEDYHLIYHLDIQEYAVLGSYNMICGFCNKQINKYDEYCPVCGKYNKKYIGVGEVKK